MTRDWFSSYGNEWKSFSSNAGIHPS